jgi:hypothetical protein
MIQTLLREYPALDHIMAQSLISAYEAGTLDKLLEECKDNEISPLKDVTIPDAICVGEKNDLIKKTECVEI